MDPTSVGGPDFVKDVVVEGDHNISPNSDQHPPLLNKYRFNLPSPNLNFIESSWLSPDPGHADFAPPIAVPPAAEPHAPFAGDSLATPSGGTIPEEVSSSDDIEFSGTILKYISEMLMEENVENKSTMLYDPLGLRVTEKSLYDALGQKYPPSPNPYREETLYLRHSSGSSDDVFSRSGGGDYRISSSSSTSNGTAPQWIGDVWAYRPSSSQAAVPGDYVFQPNSQPSNGLQFQITQSNSVTNIRDGEELLSQKIFTDRESVLQFRRGLEEASRFLPRDNQLVMELGTSMLPQEWKEKDQKVEFMEDKGVRANSTDGLRGRKNQNRQDVDVEEGRNNKLSAVYVEDNESSEMFDKVLLSTGALSLLCDKYNNESLQNEASRASHPNGQPQGANSRKNRAKRQGKKKDTVDLRNLLILCAQAVSTGNHRTANGLLKQIRQHSSPHGDGSQRLAHYFANALEARMAGTGTSPQTFFCFLFSNRVSAFELLKAHTVLLSISPFGRISPFFANQMIYKVAGRATSLHIIDFGIQYGFHWPILIKKLSERVGGPPKLRITGIEFPQPGLRPTERIEETGRQLAKYCEQFNVPFEYHSLVSKNWETIQIEDLKIDRYEILAVNCFNRFKNLLGETVEKTSPRDGVLKLIRSINPDIFVTCHLNGAHDGPFFVTRFREALFHFSAFYNILDATLPRDNKVRLMLEREIYGREAMNVIAYEGLERIERPETYKNWHIRSVRAGFRPLPLDQELLTTIRSKLKEWYHEDFFVDEDNHWMLQGWRGRVLFGCSCWVPN